LKIVLDTNVLVSAFLRPGSKPAKILRLALQGEIQIIVNEGMLSEYNEVLGRPKFELEAQRVQTILETIRSKSIRAPALAASLGLPDAKDEIFLEAALAAKADALITGNKSHFPKPLCRGQTVWTPEEFLRELGYRYS
jgi:putative PIN family toxin of toxin-antitoxin system